MDSEGKPTHERQLALQTLLISWGLMRLVVQLPALFASSLRPLTELEAKIAIWPPSAPWGEWLARVLLLPWQRWDTVYYLRIVTRGYALTDGTAQFHPLFPWLAKLPVLLGCAPLTALWMVSSVATAVLLVVFFDLAHLDMPPSQARYATLALLCSPFAFALFVPYAESLFLVWAVLCLYWGRRQKWLWAGAAGALATLTRQQGLFLLVPLAWEMWEAAGRDARRALRLGRAWAGPALLVLSYGIWVIYRAFALGDVRPDWSSLHALVYSVLISPSAAAVVPVQTFMWPWQAFGIAWRQMLIAPDVDGVVNIVGGMWFLVLTLLAWPRICLSDRLYTAVIVAVSFGYQTGFVHPYMGLLRHLLLAFPVFLGLGKLGDRPTPRAVGLGVGVLAQWLLLMLYWLEAWVP